MTRIISCGIRFYNSNQDKLNSEDDLFIQQIRSQADNIIRADSYEKKLNIWCDLNLNRYAQYWVGDFSMIKDWYNTDTYPEPELYLSVYPTTVEQVVKFNILNINSAIKELGTFDYYKNNYLNLIEGQRENPLTRGKIRIDLRELKKSIEHRNFLKDNLQTWYESFKNSEDSLIYSHYRIYYGDINIQLFSKLSMFSYYAETAYLRYLIDKIEDVRTVAEAYLLNLKIPFLEELLTAYDTVPVTVENITVEPEPQTYDTPKSKKKGNQLTTKQQMILLDKLGFFDLSVLRPLTTQHKAVILANILHRSEQEMRSMLTYWQTPNAPKDYDCSQPKDIEIVMEFLANNNLLP